MTTTDTYRAMHTMDELGGTYREPLQHFGPSGSLDDAIQSAEVYALAGQGGFVQRDSDGATLMPDGTWQ